SQYCFVFSRSKNFISVSCASLAVEGSEVGVNCMVSTGGAAQPIKKIIESRIERRCIGKFIGKYHILLKYCTRNRNIRRNRHYACSSHSIVIYSDMNRDIEI